MVRLKDKSSNLSPDISLISIPYGAIKSFLLISKKYKLFIISIPYGAIKRK